MATKEELKILIQPREDGSFPSLQEVGNHLGVTRERVRQILEKHRITKPRAKKIYPSKFCIDCGIEINHTAKSGRCGSCYHKRVSLNCFTCEKTFDIGRSSYKARIHVTGTKRESKRVTPLFCSRRCYGVWFGKNFGFKKKESSLK